jgi:hypothetical protein
MVFYASDKSGKQVQLKWYPSEYLYREKEDQYCFAAEKYTRNNEIMLGGTFLRQNNFIFNVDTNEVGYARAQCNDDLN